MTGTQIAVCVGAAWAFATVGFVAFMMVAARRFTHEDEAAAETSVITAAERILIEAAAK